MHLGRRKRTATAVAAAVIGGLLGGAAPGAVQAAPVPPSADAPATTPTGPAATATATAGPSPSGTSGATRVPASASSSGGVSEAEVPAVWPRPQSLAGRGPAVRLGDEVTLLADDDADPYALAALRELLAAAGVRTVHTGLPGGGPVFRVAGPSGEAAEEALAALRVPERLDLPRGGYRLATGRVQGRDTVVLDGVGDDGLFHAVQTLRQLIGTGREVPGVVVRDWPGTAERGLTEGFYGRPWTREQRLAQIDFLGRTKQNRYLYAPGDDPYRQAQWREPYPAEQQAEFRALAERARAHHVTLGWAVAPAQSMCLSSGADMAALTRKFDAMWALGVRSFQLQFPDAGYGEWHCSKDADTFGRDAGGAAAAHARVANAVARHLAERYPDAEPLTVLPTEYYQDGATAYRTELAGALDADVRVAWTGVGVVPRTITGGELAGAREALGHPLVTMDNYPVNDYAQDRLFLGPSTGRDPAVAAGSAAFLAHAMEQPAASRIPLFTAADYAWNPKGYRPQESWRAAVDDLAGPDPDAREALRALAGNDASSILDPKGESAYLKPLLAAFRSSRTSTDTVVKEKAARELRAAFTVMRGAPERLAATADGALDDETGPWLEQLSRYGLAGETAVDMLLAQTRGDGAAAWQAQLRLEPLREALEASPVTVGSGVLDPFLTRAVAESEAWTGADRTPARQAERAPDSYTVRLDRARPVEALTVLSEPSTRAGTGAGAGARVEAYVPGEGWRPLGPLSVSGWTQTELKGLRADALRVVWDGEGPAPEVRSLVPWFADGPRAGLTLARTETDAEIGGPAQRVDVELSGLRAGEVRGPMTAKAPKGIAIRLPKQAVVERGARTTVPLEVSVGADVPAGSYRVPVSFAGEERVLTVRAFPRTAGPDLARAATASSSGDETPDFPAASAVDGDAATRWSSPAEDGSWWQVELAEPARIGQVVLHWQDAYASRYRVQVSADGRVWRTAATVSDGRGGRESVRMDATDTRFLRVQGEARATPYGYSLWSVETYAVAPQDPPGKPGTPEQPKEPEQPSEATPAPTPTPTPEDRDTP
ncbi:beta-N-acetylglucosaminidase domain-containing protein [Streptomyces sp. NBC_00094]|uniref:beta-N-acetylglucosaminidase domain-containing protein n=1 Tax=Streptomyces sp. NBC_00094 TaxID=2903620 RepID=UPI00224E21EE|nr:beta-N-acetylglucosaminidase domain-containing protein [Streptomyces sp. NBC_00094]MCX5390744.1 beta-N-acetylglucosaminidase domain-containing protein [Streptomyces sp. NBC_00094]